MLLGAKQQNNLRGKQHLTLLREKQEININEKQQVFIRERCKKYIFVNHCFNWGGLVEGPSGSLSYFGN